MAFAIALSSEGAFVTVAGRTEVSLEGTARAITKAGRAAQALTCHVTVAATTTPAKTPATPSRAP
ncbi:hypothetical protein AB0G54_23820 [Streptomyces yokosukanensis]|uniref:hypothetical protein n=1 Tax=Streptomyces yokosukanensis TaxID=67386 RepID=UPI00342B65F9